MNCYTYIKNKLFFFSLLSSLIWLTISSEVSAHAIFNVINGGRLGDQLLNYTKTLWISYRYKLDFYYTPFEGSNLFMLHTLDTPITDKIARSYPQRIKITNCRAIRNSGAKTIYVSDLWVEDDSWGGSYLKAFRDDSTFLSLIRQRLTFRYPVNTLKLPTDALTVAVHVRRGSFNDKLRLMDKPLLMKQKNRHLLKRDVSFTDVIHPDKFSPDSYHIEQIEKIAQLFPDKKLYVYIFTDDPSPRSIAEDFAEKLNNPNITFDYRKSPATVYEDFFSMLTFDCLIRTNSGFSEMAHLLGNYKVVFWPEVSEWDDTNTLTVTKVGIDIASIKV